MWIDLLIEMDGNEKIFSALVEAVSRLRWPAPPASVQRQLIMEFMMANVCTFKLKVKGPPIQRRAFRTAVEKHVERIKEGPFAGEYIVMLDPSIWGRLEYDRFFWGLPHDGEQPGFIQPIEDGLEITGESKWSPPLEFMDRASRMFPELSFDLTSNTEHELYEQWVGQEGEVAQVLEVLVQPETDEVLRVAEDGEVILEKTASD